MLSVGYSSVTAHGNSDSRHVHFDDEKVLVADSVAKTYSDWARSHKV